MSPKTETFNNNINDKLVFLDPVEDVEIDPSSNVRPWSEKETDADREAIERLAGSIENVGQLEPVVVYESGEGKYALVAGRRRYEAVVMLNMTLGDGESPYILKAVVRNQPSKLDAFRQALHENLQRKAMTPMDMASNIAQAKKLLGVEGKTWAEEVAKLFGISRAQITQLSKLTKLDAEVQARIHAGRIPVDAGLALIDNKVPSDKQVEVIDKASLAHQTAVSGGQARDTGKDTSAKAVKKAAREDSSGENKPLTRKEILENVGSLFYGTPLYGGPDGPIPQFWDYFLNRYCQGKGTDSTLQSKFDAMVEKTKRGTAEWKAQVEEKKTTKKTTKKKAAKKVSKKKVSKKASKKKTTKKVSKSKDKESADQE